MKSGSDKTSLKERNLTYVIKVLLILVLVTAGLGITTLLGDVTGGGKWVLGVCGALGGLFSILMRGLANARINLRKVQAGVRVKAYKRKVSSRILTRLSAYMVSLVLSQHAAVSEKNAKKTKAETITELFLFDKQSSLNTAKKVALWGVVVNAVMYFFVDLPFATTGLFLGIIALLQVKEELLIYRVNHGYFGSTTREAMMLIKFINAQDDDSDMNAGGRRKPIFKDVVCEDAADAQDLVGNNR